MAVSFLQPALYVFDEIAIWEKLTWIRFHIFSFLILLLSIFFFNFSSTVLNEVISFEILVSGWLGHKLNTPSIRFQSHPDVFFKICLHTFMIFEVNSNW